MDHIVIVWIISLCLGISQGQLILEGPTVSTLGGSSTYICLSSDRMPVTNDIQWLVNETVLNETSTFLELTNLTLEHNGSCIRCKANTQSSNCRLLLLQGLLSAVGSLMLTEVDYGIILNWTAPFTLDITFVNPDITYCVNVISSATLHSECGINGTEYTFLISGCVTYYFTIIPMNIVGNGTSSLLNYTLSRIPTVENLLSFEPANCTASQSVIIVMTAPVCRVKLTLVDIETGETITLGDTDLTIAETNITFTTQQLRQNRHYNVTVTASNIAGSNASETKLSTHDIQNVELSQQIDELNISVKYSEYSCAAGALLIFRNCNETVCFSFLALNKTASIVYPFPFDLLGQYEMFVYDIESDGTIASDGVGYPAVNRKIVINGTTEGLSCPPSSYSLLDNCSTPKTTTSHIIVECFYPDDSMATGFQMIVQLSNSNILYVNKTTDNRTTARVVVEENGLYQVAIFPIRGERGIVDSHLEYSKLVRVNNSPVTDSANSLTTNATMEATPDSTPTMTTTTTTVVNRKGQISSLIVAGGLLIVSIITVIMVVMICLVKRNCSTRKKQAQLPNEYCVFTRDQNMRPTNNALSSERESAQDGELLQLSAPQLLYEDVIESRNKVTFNESNSHYAVVSEQVEVSNGPVLDSHAVTYAVTTGTDNRVYAFVDPQSKSVVDTFEASQDINKVVYSSIQHHPRATKNNITEAMQEDKSCGHHQGLKSTDSPTKQDNTTIPLYATVNKVKKQNNEANGQSCSKDNEEAVIATPDECNTPIPIYACVNKGKKTIMRTVDSSNDTTGHVMEAVEKSFTKEDNASAPRPEQEKIIPKLQAEMEQPRGGETESRACLDSKLPTAADVFSSHGNNSQNLTYEVVAPKKCSAVNTFEVSGDVNSVTYAELRSH